MEHNTSHSAENETMSLSSLKPELTSFKLLFKESWSFFKAHFKSLFAFFFLVSLIPNIAQILIQFSLIKLLPSFHSPISTAIVFFTFATLAFVVYIFSQVIQIGSIKKIHSLSLNESESALTSSKGILKFSVPIILTSVITFLFLLGGSAVFIVPGILFAISSTFMSAFVVIENKKGSDALVSSFWLVNGRRGKVITRLLFLTLSLAGIALVFFAVLASIVIGISFIVFGGLGDALVWYLNFMFVNAGNQYVPPTNLFYIFAIVLSVFSSAISVFFMGMLNIFTFKLWQNVKLNTTETIPEDFTTKTKKQIKIFAWIGLGTIVIFFILGQFTNIFVPTTTPQEIQQNNTLKQ